MCVCVRVYVCTSTLMKLQEVCAKCDFPFYFCKIEFTFLCVQVGWLVGWLIG